MTGLPVTTLPRAEDVRQRIDALQAMAVLDTPPEEGYDALVRLAANVSGMPIALVSLVDGDRLWFKAVHGLDVSTIDSARSFCAEAVNSKRPLEVSNARLDTRFATSELVSGELGIRYYAGAPILFKNVAIGTVCVLDFAPRALGPERLAALTEMANIAAVMLRARIEAFALLSQSRR